MSAYYTHQNAHVNAHLNNMYETFQRPRRVICGVCAALSANSGVPAWIIRVVAVCMLATHAALTTLAYLIAAALMRRPAAGTWRDFGGCSSVPPRPWDDGGLVNRFDRLNRRLAEMERETMDREAGLRRAFRDLDRG